jgi:hypothetical protein
MRVVLYLFLILKINEDVCARHLVQSPVLGRKNQ